jgi:FkbM family methyltransferase
MSFYPSVERLINGILAPLDILIARQSKCDSESQGHFLSRLADNAKLIGSHGACEAFIAFATKEKSDDEEDIKKFMSFYAEFFRLSRSQWSQDIFVMYSTNMKTKGSYLEIGAADGLTHSNTLALRDHLGWSGVLVEPDTDMFRVLKAARGHTDTVINAAIAPDGKPGHAHLRRAGQLSSLVGHEGTDRHAEMRMQQHEIMEIPTIDLTGILKERPQLDYFSLDVEGAELEIIRSIKWEDVDPPLLVTVEHNYRIHEEAQLRRILLDYGYIEILPEHPWLRRGDLWMQHKSMMERQ